MDNNYIKCHSQSCYLWEVTTDQQFICMCELWLRHLRYDLGSWLWHNIGQLITIVRKIIKIQQGIKKSWPGHGLWLSVHCELDLGDTTKVKFIIQLWVISINCMKYNPDPIYCRKESWSDTDFGYECKRTSTQTNRMSFILLRGYKSYHCLIAWIRIFSMYTLWFWLWRYDLELRIYEFLLSIDTIVWNTIRIVMTQTLYEQTESDDSYLPIRLGVLQWC